MPGGIKDEITLSESPHIAGTITTCFTFDDGLIRRDLCVWSNGTYRFWYSSCYSPRLKRKSTYWSLASYRLMNLYWMIHLDLTTWIFGMIIENSLAGSIENAMELNRGKTLSCLEPYGSWLSGGSTEAPQIQNGRNAERMNDDTTTSGNVIESSSFFHHPLCFRISRTVG